MFVVSRFFVTFFVLIAGFATTLSGQINAVDPAFNPVPSVSIGPNDLAGKSVVVQPDGKIVIWGSSGNYAIDGQAKGQIARLNTDGSLDTTFTYCGCLITSISNIVVQADGKLLVAGNDAQAKIVRLNANGSHDPSFISVFNGNNAQFSSADVVGIQMDGRVIANVYQSLGNGFHGRYITRLNTDGSTDTGFTSVAYDGGRLINTYLHGFALTTSGQFYAGYTTFSGPSSSMTLRKYNSNGTVDSTWEVPTMAPTGGTSVGGLAVQADGSLLMSGRFSSVNGVTKPNLVRLLSAGNVDLNFTAPALGMSGDQIGVLQNGKILVSYNTSFFQPFNTLLARLNSDGSLDNTFALSPSVSSLRSKWALDASERILFLGTSNLAENRFFRLNTNGDVDAAFNPNLTLFGQIHTLQRQTDGKILMAGNFTQLNGVARSSMARVNADGTVDSSFNAGTGFNQPPTGLIMQTDGKIIAAGPFNNFNGTARQGIARINADGSLDTAFAPVLPQSPLAAALQSDGKILIVGYFSSVNGVSRTGIARLNTDGTLDNGFNPLFGPPQQITLTAVLQQADGKIMVGGSFSGVNGFNRSGIVRLNTDGSLDQTFNAGSNSPAATRIWLQADGKYVYVANTLFVRLNIDGTADGSFVSPTFGTSGSNSISIDAVILQPDGTLIVGGIFDLVNGLPRRNFVRLTSTGSIDALFFANGADARLRTIIRQPDGKLVIGGDFAKVENVVRSGIARLSIAPYQATAAFDFDGDGRADISVFRASENRWYILRSTDGGMTATIFAAAGDVPTPADFDGDGKTDMAIFRPSNGDWWYLSSINNTQVSTHWGATGDIPRPSDFDGDGRADYIIYRPSTSAWYRLGSTGATSVMAFGITEDKPLVGDFDGDGKADPAVFRPSTGTWWYAASSANNQHRATNWGLSGDVPAPGDYDGDGKDDFAVFRPSSGVWYIYNSGNGSITIMAWGLSSDKPVAADYDGDGRADIAVFRPSTGVWYIIQSTAGFTAGYWGIATDVPVPNVFVP